MQISFKTSFEEFLFDNVYNKFKIQMTFQINSCVRFEFVQSTKATPYNHPLLELSLGTLYRT